MRRAVKILLLPIIIFLLLVAVFLYILGEASREQMREDMQRYPKKIKSCRFFKPKGSRRT